MIDFNQKYRTHSTKGARCSQNGKKRWRAVVVQWTNHGEVGNGIIGEASPGCISGPSKWPPPGRRNTRGLSMDFGGHAHEYAQ